MIEIWGRKFAEEKFWNPLFLFVCVFVELGRKVEGRQEKCT